MMVVKALHYLFIWLKVLYLLQ